MIVVVDYGMGNLRSVEKGFKKVGFDVKVTSYPEDLKKAKAIVLPGVGAFKDCIMNLQKLDLVDAILECIDSGKPYLGICLGLQILFSESEEFGRTRGLDIIKGRVKRFPAKGELKVPHMGWNQISIKKESPLLKGIQEGSFFYFVHSYYVVPEDQDVVSTTTEYGVEFTSSIYRGNIMATQFHPEKSQKLGLQVLRNFGEFVNEYKNS